MLFCTNDIGIYTDDSNNRASIGPIESFFKTLERSVVKSNQGIKLGRFIRKMDDLSKSVVRQIELAHPEYSGSSLTQKNLPLRGKQFLGKCQIKNCQHSKKVGRKKVLKT